MKTRRTKLKSYNRERYVEKDNYRFTIFEQKVSYRVVKVCWILNQFPIEFQYNNSHKMEAIQVVVCGVSDV